MSEKENNLLPFSMVLESKETDIEKEIRKDIEADLQEKTDNSSAETLQDDEAAHLMRFFLASSAVEKKVQKLKSQYMEALELNGSDLPVFLVLSLASKPLTLKEIREKASLDKAQISRAIHKMSEKDMVIRQGQGVYKASYSLSDKGREKAASLDRMINHIVGLAHASLKQENWDFYYRFSAELSQALDHMEEYLQNEAAPRHPADHR